VIKGNCQRLTGELGWDFERDFARLALGFNAAF
jgi:hypothetical protein